MEHTYLTPGQGLDEAAFARVWRRVMPRDRADCPFVVEQPAADTADDGLPAGGPALTPAGGGHIHLDGMGEDGVPCLGPASLSYAPLLQRFVEGSTAQWRLYQTLSRRSGPVYARTLGGLAAAELTHAKRLAAACFLITGVRYWPADAPGRTLPAGALPALLRGAFQGEQRSASAFLAAAAETADPALRALFLELAEEEAGHAAQIRRLLEQL